MNISFKTDKLLSNYKPSLAHCIPHSNYQLVKACFWIHNALHFLLSTPGVTRITPYISKTLCSGVYVCALILGQQYFKGSGTIENYGKQCTHIFFFLLIDILSVTWPWQVIFKMRLKVFKSLHPLDKVKKGLNKVKILLYFSISSKLNPKPFFCKNALTGDFCYTRILLIAINFCRG